MSKITLLSCPQMQELAKNISDGLLELRLHQNKFFNGSVQLRHDPDDILWGRFDDGFPDIHIKPEAINNRDIWFLASFDHPGSLFEQMAVIYAIPRYSARSLTVVLPFYPVGTMERVDREGDVATAMTMARMLGAIPLSQRGPARLVIYDIHALPNRFFFSDTVLPVLESAIPKIIAKMNGIHGDDWMVAFPDEGAQKRFKSYFEGQGQILCHKIRRGQERIVTIKEGDPRGRQVLIIDDLTHSGGTLLNCGIAIKEAGASGIEMFVSHGAFDGNSYQKIIQAIEAGWLQKFYTTDSCPRVRGLQANCKGIEIISLNSLIADLIVDSYFMDNN